MRLLTKTLLLLLLLVAIKTASAQTGYELNTGWKCKVSGAVKDNGELLSDPALPLTDWMPATVPGTVLTSQLNNK
jgi:mannosylglycoprotein endo-beta-mannosidase